MVIWLWVGILHRCSPVHPGIIITTALIGAFIVFAVSSYNTDPPPCPWYGAELDGYQCLIDFTPWGISHSQTLALGFLGLVLIVSIMIASHFDARSWHRKNDNKRKSESGTKSGKKSKTFKNAERYK